MYYVGGTFPRFPPINPTIMLHTFAGDPSRGVRHAPCCGPGSTRGSTAGFCCSGHTCGGSSPHSVQRLPAALPPPCPCPATPPEGAASHKQGHAAERMNMKALSALSQVTAVSYSCVDMAYACAALNNVTLSSGEPLHQCVDVLLIDPLFCQS
jgi:hypothetical protein